MNSDDLISSDGVFTKEQQQVIDAIANAMIRKDELLNLPSASDPRVMKTIMHKRRIFQSVLLKVSMRLMRRLIR